MSLGRALRSVDRAIESLRSARAAPGAEDGLARRDFLGIGATALASALLAACDSRGPKSSERLLRFAERRNEVVERWLLRHTAMSEPSAGWRSAGDRFPAYYVSPVMPQLDDAARAAWRLEVSGLVGRPLALALADLERLPRRRQRVEHFCVEGWSAVATFTGAALADVARAAGARADARYVDFQSFDAGYHESWDIESAMHPQTLIVYGKDGTYLTPQYGAPARLHSPVKLGYKNVKYLTKVVFMPERNGGYWSDQGYEWYGGT